MLLAERLFYSAQEFLLFEREYSICLMELQEEPSPIAHELHWSVMWYRRLILHLCSSNVSLLPCNLLRIFNVIAFFAKPTPFTSMPFFLSFLWVWWGGWEQIIKAKLRRLWCFNWPSPYSTSVKYFRLCGKIIENRKNPAWVLQG